MIFYAQNTIPAVTLLETSDVPGKAKLKRINGGILVSRSENSGFGSIGIQKKIEIPVER